MNPHDYETLADDPIHGIAGEPLDDDTVKQLLDRQTMPVASERKRRAWKIYDIFRNRFAHHVLQAINYQQSSETISADMARQITSVRNDAVDVTKQLAVVWKNGASRHLGGDGDDSDQERSDAEAALMALAKESLFDTLAPVINQLAWLQGPQFAVPMVRSGRLTTDVVGPHVYDYVQDLQNPLGMPVGLAWHLGKRKIAEGWEHSVHVLDAVYLRRYVIRGGKHELAAKPLEHNFGRLPAGCLRFTIPLAGDDWDCIDAQRRLTDGTIDVAVKMARMGLVRKAQCHKLLTMVGRLANMPKGQEKTDPEGAVVVDTGDRPQAGQVEIDVHDYDTDPKHFIHEVLFHSQSMVEPYGGHVQVDSGQPDIYGRIMIPPAVQSEHRNAQIEPALAFERDWWAASTAMLRAEQHKLAIDLPTPDEVHERLRVNFGALSRDLEDPEKAIAFEDWQLSRGQTSEVEIMQRRLGGASEDEAWREIQRNMANRGKFNELAARTNQSTKPGGELQTTPEANGAQGTPMREAIKAAVSAAEGDGEQPGGAAAPEPA